MTTSMASIAPCFVDAAESRAGDARGKRRVRVLPAHQQGHRQHPVLHASPPEVKCAHTLFRITSVRVKRLRKGRRTHVQRNLRGGMTHARWTIALGSAPTFVPPTRRQGEKFPMHVWTSTHREGDLVTPLHTSAGTGMLESRVHRRAAAWPSQDFWTCAGRKRATTSRTPCEFHLTEVKGRQPKTSIHRQLDTACSIQKQP